MNKKRSVIYFLLAALLLWASPAPAKAVPFDADQTPLSSSDVPLGEPEEENEETEQELKELATLAYLIDYVLLEPAAAFYLDDSGTDVLDCVGQLSDLPRAPPMSVDRLA